MDGRHFDDLTRTLARPASRRSVLRAVAGSLFGGALSVAGLRQVAARDCGHPGEPCTADGDCCGALPCVQGSCQPAYGGPSGTGSSSICPAGQSMCRGSCVDYASDVNNCGGCGNACSGGQLCCGGICQQCCSASDCALPQAASACVSGICAIASCDAGWGDCDSDPSNGCETDLTTTVNCGSCGNSCSPPANATAACDGTNCGFTCDGDFKPCGTNCIPIAGCCTNDDCASLNDQCHQGVCQSDHTCLAQVTQGVTCDDGDSCTTGATCQANGMCGGGTPISCPECQTCGNGQCVAVGDGTACSTGTCCEGNCVDTTSDNHNCGGCRVACATTETCYEYWGTCADSTCTLIPAPAGTSCTTVSCTVNQTCDGAGNCTGGSPMVCDDPPPCRTATGATCYLAGGFTPTCSYPFANEGESCATADVAGVCHLGTCYECYGGGQTFVGQSCAEYGWECCPGFPCTDFIDVYGQHDMKCG